MAIFMISDEMRGDEVTVAVNAGRTSGPWVSLRAADEVEQGAA